jgi:hypothetical protein
MRNALITEETEANGATGATGETGETGKAAPARQPQTDLEFVFPVLNREHTIRTDLGNAADCVRDLDVTAGIAVVDCGSSDRTLEAVDDVAAGLGVLVRVVGCSSPGWGSAALRGVTTSPARWVGFGEPSTFGRGTGESLSHAVKLLADGQHIVCTGGLTVLETSVAVLIVGDDRPDGPGFVPRLPDTPKHAGLRMTAHGSAVPGPGEDIETTVVLVRVAQ